jgi:hypothetical protein
MGQFVKYPRGNLWRKNNAPLVGYYANKYGLLLVVHLGKSAGRLRWATSSRLTHTCPYLFATYPTNGALFFSINSPWDINILSHELLLVAYVILKRPQFYI